MRTVWAGLAAMMLATAPLAAEEKAGEAVSTADLFGFTDGSTVGKQGDRGVALEFETALGQRAVRWKALGVKSEFSFAPIDGVEIAPSLMMGFARLRDPAVPSIVEGAGIAKLATEVKIALIERTKGPFGLTLILEPSLAWFDPGMVGAGHGARFEAKLALDRALIENQLFVAFNLVGAVGRFRPDGGAPVQESSALALSAAMAGRVFGDVFMGVEAVHARAYGGFGFSRAAGHAFFLGPTLWAKLPNEWELQMAWQTQLSGRARGVPGDLDLTNFSHHVGKVKFALGF